MSDTPRTDRNYIGMQIVPAFFAQKLERELNKAKSIIRQQQLLDEENLGLKERIKRLEEALGCAIVKCHYLHHRKNHQHRSGEPCPVEALIRKAKEAKP